MWNAYDETFCILLRTDNIEINNSLIITIKTININNK